MKGICTGIVIIGLAGLRCVAQTPTVQTFSGEQIGALQSVLKAQADASNGIGTRRLASYPGFYTMLIYRDRNGQVEIHQDFDEVVVVLQGQATLRTGGAPENVRAIGPGELRGTAATDAASHLLSEGATVHIPANTPHQVFVPAGSHVVYVDVKIRHGVGESARK